MNRLQSELRRLYQPPAAGGQAPAAEAPALVDAAGQVRALVLSLTGPADWDLLCKVWQGVQAEWDLPAPGIAVAGADGYQLWFSLAEPVAAPRALAFLDALQRHYLGDVKPSRIGLRPAMTSGSPPQAAHARPVPAQLPNSGHWSAFVTPDLAPVFGDEPWLDSAPNPMGQSDLLSRLQSMPAADFLRVLDQLQPAATAIDAVPAPTPTLSPDLAAAAASAQGGAVDRPASTATERHPRRFLLDVMNDDRVALGLRIDAAKALLPYVDPPERP